MVVAGILQSIEDSKKAGVGAWQMQAVQRGYELLGRYLGMFTDRLDVHGDDRLIEMLNRGRRRAAGIAGQDEEEENNEELPEEPPKPN